MIKIKRVHVPNVCVQVGKSLVKGDAYVTIAYDSEHFKEHIYNRIGLSFCSPRDQLNKKLGNLIAKGRLEKTFEIIDCNQDNTYSIIQKVMELLQIVVDQYGNKATYWKECGDIHFPKWLPSMLKSYGNCGWK